MYMKLICTNWDLTEVCAIQSRSIKAIHGNFYKTECLLMHAFFHIPEYKQNAINSRSKWNKYSHQYVQQNNWLNILKR